jgi:membrane associated rhomboid family serine protease
MLALIPLSAFGMIDNLANFAHIGGLICGALLASIYLGIIAFVSNNTQDNKEEHVE